jgi:ubiquitin C-terminal hydrolase
LIRVVSTSVFRRLTARRTRRADSRPLKKQFKQQPCSSNHQVEREQLGETEQWYCSKCKKNSRAYKKLDLWKTPDVLILHLNRFKYAQNQYFVRRQKIEDLVTFPLKGLDLGKFVLSEESKETLYDLYAVSEHSGAMGGPLNNVGRKQGFNCFLGGGESAQQRLRHDIICETPKNTGAKLTL